MRVAVPSIVWLLGVSQCPVVNAPVVLSGGGGAPLRGRTKRKEVRSLGHVLEGDIRTQALFSVSLCFPASMS
jgi:hypothetical protein